MLANSEYRHELESDIEPFKGLLLGLFFITVGALIQFDLLFGNLSLILAMTLGLIALKATVLYALSRIFGITGADRWLFTLGLAQAGEFGFVLLAFTVANSVIPAALARQLLLVVTLSMLLTPLLFILYDKLIAPRFAQTQGREADEIEEQGSVIVAGHGRYGGIVNRILLAAGFKTVVLDYQSEQLEMLRKFGIKVYFGDAMRPDLLHAAGIEEAKMLVIAIDERESATELVRYVSEKLPAGLYRRARHRPSPCLRTLERRRQGHHSRDLRQFTPCRSVRAGGARSPPLRRGAPGPGLRPQRPRADVRTGIRV